MPDAPETTDETNHETPEVDAPDPDPLREGVVEALRRHLGSAVVDHHIARGELWVRVDRAAWVDAARYLKEQQHFEYFCFLSGIDWLRNEEMATRYEKVWPEPADDREPGHVGAQPDGEAATGWQTGLAGGDSRFQVFARFYDTTRKVGITVKADLDDDRPTVDTLVAVFRGADWHEREAWEMFGFDFAGHPSLRHLYLPGEFEGHPLRKDFPLLSRVVKPWPGLVDKEPIPGEADEAQDSEAQDSEEGAS
jgi:NADH-quinone oxidoreductase subunit C